MHFFKRLVHQIISFLSVKEAFLKEAEQKTTDNLRKIFNIQTQHQKKQALQSRSVKG